MLIHHYGRLTGNGAAYATIIHYSRGDMLSDIGDHVVPVTGKPNLAAHKDDEFTLYLKRYSNGLLKRARQRILRVQERGPDATIYPEHELAATLQGDGRQILGAPRSPRRACPRRRIQLVKWVGHRELEALKG
jgi:hypothetical protein